MLDAVWTSSENAEELAKLLIWAIIPEMLQLVGYLMPRADLNELHTYLAGWNIVCVELLADIVRG